MDQDRIKRTFEFILSSHRALLAMQNSTAQFDFTKFLEDWNDIPFYDLRITMLKNIELLVKQGLFDSIMSYLAVSINHSNPCAISCSSACHSILDAKTDETQNHESLYDPLSTIICKSKGYETKRNPSFKLSKEITNDDNNINTKKLLISSNRKIGANSRKEVVKCGSSEDNEITIHVCDEIKGIREDFSCPQSILVKEMAYFSKVAVKGQKLRDMDISVHCDISIFSWLMNWVRFHKSNGPSMEPFKADEEDKARKSPRKDIVPGLDVQNVIGLLVSADFLQMSELAMECLRFTYENLAQVINHSPNLGCLNESLTARLLHYFDNHELESRIYRYDKGDRITSRLYMQLILSLNDVEPESARGHFASTSSLYRCIQCNQLLINDVSSKVLCTSMQLDSRGRLYAQHKKDDSWSLPNHVKELKKELKSWRKVYWRLWGTVHFLVCDECHMYFAVKNFDTCPYHFGHVTEEQQIGKRSSKEISSDNDIDPNKLICRNSRNDDNTDPKSHSHQSQTRRYFSCCNGTYHHFSYLPDLSGCKRKNHSLNQYDGNDPLIKLLQHFRELIIEPNSNNILQNVTWTDLISLVPKQRVFSKGTTCQQRLKRDFFKQYDNSVNSSDGDDGEGDGYVRQPSSRKAMFPETWSWNPDYTTRYNQDMQREKEEKLMLDLELLLSQKHSINSSLISLSAWKLNSHIGRSKVTKVNAGSYLKLEEQWRDERGRSQKKSKALKENNTSN